MAPKASARGGLIVAYLYHVLFFGTVDDECYFFWIVVVQVKQVTRASCDWTRFVQKRSVILHFMRQLVGFIGSELTVKTVIKLLKR